LMYDGVKAGNTIPDDFKGHNFTKEEKEDLMKLGHLGKTVDMENAKGGKTPHFVSIDKDTRTMLRWEASNFKPPKVILGVPISKENQELLKQGRPIFVAGMRDRLGQEFSSYIVADAVNKKLAFVPKNSMLDKYLAPEHKPQAQKNEVGSGVAKSTKVEGAEKPKELKPQTKGQSKGKRNI
jgi:Protein of unknown function (DUF3945)